MKERNCRVVKEVPTFIVYLNNAGQGDHLDSVGSVGFHIVIVSETQYKSIHAM